MEDLPITSVHEPGKFTGTAPGCPGREEVGDRSVLLSRAAAPTGVVEVAGFDELDAVVACVQLNKGGGFR